MSDGLPDDEQTIAEMRRKAGHQEILGETLAKFEFFSNGWHPYTRFLDVDKIDLVLRRRRATATEYREIQVKFGKLYALGTKWERELFSLTSWRFFSERDLVELEKQRGLYVCYVLAQDGGFRGDLFVFPVVEFAALVRGTRKSLQEKYRTLISCTRDNPPRWYIWSGHRVDSLRDDALVDVTRYYRNFACLG
jgi:hypothetical protein